MSSILRVAGRAASVSLLALAAPAFAQSDTPSQEAVLKNYADIALATYEDALTRAKALEEANKALTENASAETLQAARDAWKASRPAYQQSEAFRFGNPIVDDWEGRVNAWPLDEGLIDYVDAGYGTESDSNPLYVANVIANEDITLGGETIDVTTITPELLQDKLQEAGGVEANVATGYHAIEFLLWGQDLNGTEAGAGDRPATDFASGEACTHGHCDRRGAYLNAASELLVSDLQEMVGNWQEDGAARKALLDNPTAGISAILTGMGSLSYGELAGERMKLGLLLHDPEEEHDCFSDNTHVSHYYDVVGIENVYTGSYERIDGSKVEGASVSDLVEAKAPEVDEELKSDLQDTLTAMRAVYDAAEGGEAYDQQIGEGNADGNARVQKAIDGLIAQTRTIERAVAALDLGDVTIEGSDSLDNVDAVFQ
ncbi:MAG: peptidase [Fulvimarina manganoxydans]|uniref:imelysin family protein n=1 Tax=Fulvimarina manganoxydans TaxID=937218 RepID=UPI00235380A1|nr:imelysin family protein [Fulvimarina manganoxydans]MCK5932055.1 peptidase [Fulvimarina manganoxydans]